MVESIVLLEYEDKRVDIDEKILNNLISLNDKFVDPETGAKKQFLSITKHTDGWHIKARNWVGLVKVGDFTLEILPKLTRKNEGGEIEKDEKDRIVRNLVKMLQIAWDIPIRDVEIAALKAEINSVFEIILTIYSTKLLDTLKDGLYREYVQISEDRKYVKGQIRFEEYSKRWERRHIIPIRYNSRTADNFLNRVLKYAAYVGAMYTEDDENFRRLKNIVNMMDGVSLSPVSPSSIESITFNRLNEVYKPLVNLASIIISNISPEYTLKKREIFTFLIPMEKVFEKFVANTILRYKRDILENCSGAKVWVQGASLRRYLLKERKFELIPDIYIECGEGKYIVDTKYKLLDKDDRKYGVSQADAYQMHAYATVYKTEGIMLLYPKTLLDIEPKRWTFTGINNSNLLVDAVDIGMSFDLVSEFHKFIEDLSKIFKNLFGEVHP